METNGPLMNALRSQSISTQIISLFVVLSVALGIASVLSVSVVQRTREIGILRAMGTKRQQMLRVFLLQGVVFGLSSSLLGSAAGYGLETAFNSFGPRRPNLQTTNPSPVKPTLAKQKLRPLRGVTSSTEIRSQNLF